MEIYFVRHGQSTENVAQVDGIAYDNNNIILTKRGETQAKITGKYLKNIGKFDIIFHSPATRCEQTAEIINKELKCDNIISTELLYEIGAVAHDLGGLSIKDWLKQSKRNKKLEDIKNNLIKETNIIKRNKLNESISTLGCKEFHIKPDMKTVVKNYEEFLNMLKDKKYKKYKRVLVVGHSALKDTMLRIITNINVYNNFISFGFDKNTDLFVENGNCFIMFVVLKDGKYELIIPPNNLHIK
jgi:broad specificity phosphatase PhoE